MIKKIISGGQTGADRAALDVAMRLSIPHGGCIPKGRLAEDGPISKKYNLQEMPSASYPKRTKQNVVDSDGTLILSHGKLAGGSKYTKECADKHNRPCLHINLNTLPVNEASLVIVDWIFKNKIEVLNVAGSRASKDSKIYEQTYHVIN
ncbi:MAG: putative molybdenum carrier protein [Candidatus Hermodarchaeota archaeon]